MGRLRNSLIRALFAGGFLVATAIIIGQEVSTGAQNGAQPQPAYQNMTPEQRAAATRTFLGLGPEPDRAAAARGAPLYQRNCAFCHGPQARGATGSSLITADEVLGDDHGERLVPFLKVGRPEKGMPAFATMSDNQLEDIGEFVHLQVEDVANRGTYRVLNILVGNAAKGQAYVDTHCLSCHTAEAFAHIGSRFRSPEQLQRGWIWPTRPSGSSDNSLAITATVETPGGTSIAGRVTQVSDFRIALIDSAGQTHAIDRKPGVTVRMTDPLAAHQEMIMTLANDDMHDVTAYLETLK
jgi:mono/diheme cytochrome c family protein